MDTQQRWYFCLKHQTVEPEDGCPAKDRLGPYRQPGRGRSTRWRPCSERNEEWDAADDDPD